MIIEASRVLTPDLNHEPGWIELTGRQITAVGSGKPPGEADYTVETLAPGFIDAHIHGGGGYSFNDADPQAADHIVDIHLQYGTTSMLASLVAAPIDELIPLVRRLSEKVHAGIIAGIHLEGPWLSPDHRGAHDPAFLQAPRLQEVRKILDAGAGTIRMITLAPELEGSHEAIWEITAHGAVAALGHTGASYDQTHQAIAAGARVGTHVFNAMGPIHHREPGPVPALLENSSVFAEIIADGVHLHPAAIRTIFNSPCKPVLVTDAMAAAGAPNGRYKIGRLDVHVCNGQARLTSNGSIAGSTLTLDAALRFAVHTTGIPLPLAIKALTEHPAGMLDLKNLGRIEILKRADLVALDADLNVTAVMRAGRWVARPAVADKS